MTCLNTDEIPWEEWWDLWKDTPEIATATEELTKTHKYKIINTDDETGDTVYLLHNAIPWPRNIGFPPLFVAYHSFTEEAFFLKGACQILTDCGVSYVYRAGSYIWRPPGWVHDGHHHDRWTLILYTYGGTYAGKSGWTEIMGFLDVSTTGQNLLYPTDLERANGPRGYIKCLHSDEQPWEAAERYLEEQGWTWGEGNNEKLWFKTLSKDRYTGATSYLLKIDPSADGVPYTQPGARYSLVAEEGFVVEGEVHIGGEGVYRENYYFSRPASYVYGEVFSNSGATLFCKCDGVIRRVAADPADAGRSVPPTSD